MVRRQRRASVSAWTAVSVARSTNHHHHRYHHRRYRCCYSRVGPGSGGSRRRGAAFAFPRGAPDSDGNLVTPALRRGTVVEVRNGTLVQLRRAAYAESSVSRCSDSSREPRGGPISCESRETGIPCARARARRPRLPRSRRNASRVASVQCWEFSARCARSSPRGARRRIANEPAGGAQERACRTRRCRDLCATSGKRSSNERTSLGWSRARESSLVDASTQSVTDRPRRPVGDPVVVGRASSPRRWPRSRGAACATRLAASPRRAAPATAARSLRTDRGTDSSGELDRRDTRRRRPQHDRGSEEAARTRLTAASTPS